MEVIDLIKINDDLPIALIDVVFVHGLGGDAYDTWQILNQPESFWPKWLSDHFPFANVFSVYYPAAATRWSSDASPMGLLERSRNILEYLSLSDIGKRPIIFVCHSLGGLMVKQLLYTAATMNNNNWTPILRSTKRVVFLATPHTGSGLSQLASKISLLVRPSAATKDLELGSEYLQHLGDWFRQNARKLNIGVDAYYETVKLGPVTVVDSMSGNPTIDGCVPVPVDADHITIAKPKSRKDIVYKGVLRSLENLLASLITTPKPLLGFILTENKSEFTNLYSQLTKHTIWSGSEFYHCDTKEAGNIYLNINRDGDFCFVFFIDIVKCNYNNKSELSAIEFISSIRQIGRKSEYKPIFVIYSNSREFDDLLSSLSIEVSTALRRYFFIDKLLSLPELKVRLENLNKEILEEWEKRPQSSFSLL